MRNSCIITQLEIVEEFTAECLGGTKSLILQILQRKGAPVRGVIVLEFNFEEYDLLEEQDPRSRDIKFTWIKRAEPANEKVTSNTILSNAKRFLQAH